jgi:hypothetical protein
MARWIELSTALFERLSQTQRRRLLALVFLLPSATVLGIAFTLDADPSGVGTHTQLGLSQCSMLFLTGWPCPMCGMTTTFTHLAHGQVLAGTLNQPFGLALFVLTLGTAAVSLWELLTAQGRLGAVLAWALARDLAIAGGVLAGLFGGWIYKVLWLRDMLPWGG